MKTWMIKRDSHVNLWRMSISDSKHKGPQMRIVSLDCGMGSRKATVMKNTEARGDTGSSGGMVVLRAGEMQQRI